MTHSTPLALKREATPPVIWADDGRLPLVRRAEVEPAAPRPTRRAWRTSRGPGAGSARSAPRPSSGCSPRAGRCRRAPEPARCRRRWAPSWAARIAAVYPPGPPPRTATSHFHLGPIYRRHNRRQNGEARMESITSPCITGDAPANVEFYARTLGLRLVKKTVNQDDPTVYHLFYADENGSAGADITFFEYPGAPRGRAGRRDGAPDRLPRRLGGGARLLGRTAGRRAKVRLDADPRPGGPRARAGRRRVGRRAPDRPSPRDPERARAARLRGGARLLVGLRAKRACSCSGTRLHAGLGGPR